MLGLSVSNIIVDFVRPEPNTITPVIYIYTSSNTTRDQTAYINNYCNENLPLSENFTLALVIHGAALLLLHYLWKVYFSARIHDRFPFQSCRLSTKLETLRDRDTGEYPHKNFSVVDYMYTEFHERRDILIGYFIKLATQTIVASVTLALYLHWAIPRL